jgi:hypothetical protein
MTVFRQESVKVRPIASSHIAPSSFKQKLTIHPVGVWAGVTDGLEEVTEATENSRLPDDARDCNLSVKVRQTHA